MTYDHIIIANTLCTSHACTIDFYRVGDQMPDRVAVHLPSMLSRRMVYEMMVEECKDKDTRDIRQSQFYKLWDQHYSHVTNTCISLVIVVYHVAGSI